MVTSLASRTDDGPGIANLQHAWDFSRHFFSTSGFALFALLAQSYSVAAGTDPADFIDALGNQTIEVIQDSSSLHQKQILFPSIAEPGFRSIRNIPLCSRLVLAGCQ